MSIEVVLVDEQALVRVALSAWLGEQASLRVLGDAPDACGGLKLAELFQPHVMIVDWHLECRVGIELERACLELRRFVEQVGQASPGTRVLALTAQGEAGWHYDAVVWGVHGLAFCGQGPCHARQDDAKRRPARRAHRVGQVAASGPLQNPRGRGLRRQAEGRCRGRSSRPTASHAQESLGRISRARSQCRSGPGRTR